MTLGSATEDEMAEKTEKVPVKTEPGRAGLLEAPWEPLAHLRDEMDKLFDEFTSGWPWGSGRRRRRGMMEPFREMMEPFRGGAFGAMPGAPATDVIDRDKDIQVRAELPGMNEKDIEVRLSDGLLTIHGEKKEEREEGEAGGNYYVAERRYGTFQRSLRIPEGIDADKVEATFKNGVLTVTLPKTKEAQERTRKIDVKAEK